MKYRFNPSPATANFSVLPAGDYSAIVVECGEPVLKESKNWVMKVRLSVGSDNATVFDNPWARSEESDVQDGRDGIAQFLIACGMAPASGKEPNFPGCVGKKARVKIKVGKNQDGTDRNEVAFYYAPSKTGKAAATTASTSEFEKARAAAGATPKTAAAEPEPDDLPY